MEATAPANIAALTERDMLRGADTQPPTIGLLMAMAMGGVPALLLGMVAATQGLKNPWVLPLAVVTFAVNALVILMDLRYGLALFILATALSPKLPGGTYNNFRVEDFIFVLVFGIWLLKALQRGTIPVVRSPLILPFVILTAFSIVASLWGVGIGEVRDVKYSFLLQAKRVEYLLIFWVVATTVRSENWLRLLFLVFVASGVLASVYGLVFRSVDLSTENNLVRVNGPMGENYNTLSGYLVVVIGAGLALLPQFKKTLPRMFLIAGTSIAGVALLLSFSREGYIMLAGSLLVFGFTRHRTILLAAALTLLIGFMIAEPVREHTADIVEQIQRAQYDDPGSNSLTARYRGWNYYWHRLVVNQPVVGNGVGSVDLWIDNEYLLRLCEVGVVGLIIFLWWLSTIGLHLRYLTRLSPLTRCMGIGAGAGFVGLLIQGMAGASFNTIRTMEPFWFLVGLAVASGSIYKREQRALRMAQDASPAEMARIPVSDRLRI